MHVDNNNTKNITLTTTGVGVGTTSPGEKLEVVGNISASGNFIVNQITASGNVDFKGNLNAETISVTDTITADSLVGTIGTAAQTTITSLGTLTTLTVDDITINGSTISDAGDLLFDIGGDISLDAAGGDFIFLISPISSSISRAA